MILREENRLRVFENRVLRRTFGKKGDELTGGWENLHNEEFHNLGSLPRIIRMITSRWKSWARNVTLIGEKRYACRLLVGKTERKGPLRRSIRK
jgi:hypothetical protein